jgi:hypothetical protein
VWFAGLLVAALIAGSCAQPAPSSIPTQAASPSPAAVTQPPTASPSPAPTRTPVPTPAPTLAIRGIEVFPGGADTWAMAATATNIDEIPHISVLRSITNTIEIYAECVGTGTLAVSVNASPPLAESPAPEPVATPYSLTTFDLPCPDAQGVSFGGGAPSGWFVASDAVPSDPSIRYQILIATAIR